ncbi:BTAD domain-containing putative transcriptional regulator [Phytomonospora endophytica]|uniref:Putative ATPase/DNA-binding SARP family transcriptional activator n=1 Tax=Phytomonospora endophytica TaxID=714109 RepID=A0A841FHF8_9ACTN|nr:BTAD domain-containing putative transcriptional regulator [Phytomonospora endophytica]MBB6034413.1 putative ATPase/DNA-binding SARP family transcriptional activator [Phytomonospora endophytica]GIG66807.1 SARP family transcriptional regulator [Phytomonospora endophytica]
MKFGVLGAVGAWTDDGVRVEIPEAKVRTLLAILLTVPGKVVSADRLIRELWDGDEPPANPNNALQHKVSQLRRVFDAAEPGARKLIAHRPPGYLLDVAEDAVDAGRFRGLLREARATEDPAGRETLLAEALAHWTDPEPGTRWAETAGHVEDARRAVEELAETRLELGRHEDALEAIGRLVTAEPLRPRALAAHMRALAGLGRHGEAADGYSRHRELLAEDSGLDPSPELTELHRAILRQDPALAPAGPPRTNLPAPVGALIGREAELASVHKGLASTRLVTLAGPGGVGKTRLAVEAARAFTDRPVWFLDLATLPTHAGREILTGALAAALGLSGEASADPALALRTGPVLLVVDNCEHVIDAAASVCAHLLAAAPELRVLATSREPLAVAGEAVRQIAPLPPDAAAELFRSRATVPSGTDADRAVASIVTRLDGIPLALELAATRVRTLGLHGLAHRLGDRFTVLTGGPRDAPDRQRTLRAMIDWSWELATVPERTALRRLSVFAGSWTAEAAEAVTGLDLLDVLPRLADRSLVTTVDAPGGTRHRLLETIRAYAAERLDEAGETHQIRLRHLDHHLAEATRHTALPERLTITDTEAADLHAALGNAVAEGDERARVLADALAWPWILRGRYAEAARGLETVLALGEDPKLRVWRTGAGLLAGETTEADLSALAEAVEDKERPWAFWFLAHANRGFGDLDTTAALTDRAIALCEDGSPRRWALAVRATIRRAQGDLAGAEQDAAAAARYAETPGGDPWLKLSATNTLAELAEIRGDHDRAERLHATGLRVAEELGLWVDASFRLSGLGRIALLRGDHATADERHRRAADLARAQGHVVAEEFAEVGLALSARRRGRFAEAETLLSRWVDWLRTVDGEPGLALVLAELGFAAEQRGDTAKALRLHRDGLAAARRIGDPRAVALAVEGLAGAHAADGGHTEAARLLGAATALRESVGAPLPEGERGDVDRIATVIREALGEGRFRAELALAPDPDTVS